MGFGEMAADIENKMDKATAPSRVEGVSDPEEVFALVGDDEGGGSGDVADEDTAADELEEFGDFEQGTEDAEHSDHEAEHRHEGELVAGGHAARGKEREDHQGGGIGRAEDGVPGAGKERGNDGGNCGGGDAIDDGKFGDGGVGHALWEGEEGNIEGGPDVGAEFATVVVAEGGADGEWVETVVEEEAPKSSDGRAEEVWSGCGHESESLAK